jgi:uncharacterized phage protein gp47/JayE
MIVLPTIQELTDSIITDLETEFESTINEEGRAFLRALSTVTAGKLKQYYLTIGLLQKNIFVDACDEETLKRFGIIKIGRYPFAAVAARYQIQVTGTVGGVIPAETTFKSDDDALNPGILYILDTAFTMAASTELITVRSLTLGLEGKLDVSDTLTATAPIPLVNSGASVITEAVQPLAAETIEAYRDVIKASYRLEAQGGAATDYRIWSADAQGVAKVYPYAKSNAVSEVNLFIEANLADSSDSKGTPTQAIIDAVETVVNFNPDITLPTNERGRRPLQVIVNYLPVTIKQVDIIITGSVNFSVSEKAQILSELTDYISTIRPFVAAADLVADRNDTIDNNNITGVIVATKPGAVFTALTIKINSVTLFSYQFLNGDIPYLASVTYN